MDDNTVLIIIALISTLLGGGLIGSIATGLSTRSVIKKTNADALLTYQKIADLASASELAARIRAREIEEKADAVIERMEVEAQIRSQENTQLKRVISSWVTGIAALHGQLKEKEMVPRWKPDTGELSFLKE